MLLPFNCVNVSFHKRESGNQTSSPVHGNNDVLHMDGMCYNCDSPGQYSGQFILLDICRTGTQSLRLGYNFSHTTPVQKYLIDSNWILIDSCSVVILVMNTSLISYINYCNTDTDIHVFTNGGHLDYKYSGIMDLFPLKVFYNQYSIANILKLVDVTIQFRVTMDINNKPVMIFHTRPEPVLKFYKWQYFCTFIILLTVMHLILPLMFTLSLVPSNITIFSYRA